jgi:iron complex outermembrane recepter protein
MKISTRTQAKCRRYMATTAIAAALATAAHAQQSPAPAVAPTSAATSVSEIVVTGQRAAIKSALNIKQTADVVLDAVSVDDAGKLPDNSVTEVLQRLPGVNITRIQSGATSENYLAEGTDITVRGFDTVSQVNGHDAFSAANGRALAWEDISPELMRSVEIDKSEAAYLPEGAFGGVINLNTNMPFNYSGLTVNGSVGGNYADYAGKAHPDANILFSDRWQTPVGEFGLLLSGAYSDLSTKADGVQVQPYYAEAYDPTLPSSVQNTNTADGTRLPNLSDPGSSVVYVPQGVDFTQRNDDRTREGFYGALQWRPNDQLQFGLTVFNTDYQLDTKQYELFSSPSVTAVVPPGANATFNSAGLLTSTSALAGYTFVQPGSLLSGPSNLWGYTGIPYNTQSVYSQARNQTTDITLDADWKPNDRLDVKFALQNVDSSATEVDEMAFDYALLPGLGLNLSSYGSSKLPQLAFPSTTNLANPANYGYMATEDHLMHNQGTEHAFYIDGKYKLNDDGLFRDIRFGLKLTDRNESDDQTPYNYQQLSPYYNGAPYELLTSYPQYSTLVNTGSWFNGAMGLPAQMLFPSMTELQTNFGTLHTQLGSNSNYTGGPVAWLPGDDSSVRETTETVYLMTDFKDDNFAVPFAGNIGLRVVAANDHASGDLLLPETGYTVLTPQYYPPQLGYGPGATGFSWAQSGVNTSGGRSEVDVLPSFNIQFIPVQKLHIRFAASEGLNRPDFAQLNPQGTLSSSVPGTYNQNWISSLQGNPNLKPEKALQLDFSAEYYWSKTGVIQFAAFYKSISNYIGTKSAVAVYQAPAVVAGGNLAATPASYGYGAGLNSINACATPMAVGEACTQSIPYTSQSYFNEGASATVQGFEVGLIRYADFLPAPWDGFGINVNYTYIDSKQPGAVAYDMLGNKINNLPVTGLSTNTVNVAWMYDNGPFSARLAYNWRSSYLVTTSAYQTSGSYDNETNVPDTTYANSTNQFGVATYFALPVFSYPTGQLDFNLTYKLNKRITWVLEGSNITKETARLYMGSGSETVNRSWYTADRRFTTALHFNF